MNTKFKQWLEQQNYHYMRYKEHAFIVTKGRNILTSSWDEIIAFYESNF